jgi:hypothetical protein
MQPQQNDFQQRSSRHMMEEKTASSTMLLGKLDIHMQKTETRSLSLTLYQYQLKVDQRP